MDETKAESLTWASLLAEFGASKADAARVALGLTTRELAEPPEVAVDDRVPKDRRDAILAKKRAELLERQGMLLERVRGKCREQSAAAAERRSRAESRGLTKSIH